MTQARTRKERLAAPLARDVVRQLAIDHGGCIRPVQLRRTDLDTGQTEQVLVPCGTPLPTSAHPAQNAPRHCGPRSAGKAGISTPSP